jgi:hypothetical protein
VSKMRKRRLGKSIEYGVACVMNEVVSEIKPAEIYSDLSGEEIAEMMAEAAKVDALFQSGQISTLLLADTLVLTQVVVTARPDVPATAA